MKNGLRAALRAGRPVFGTWLQFGHTAIAEVLAQAGFEWIGIDLEHSVIGLETLQPLVQVIELSGCVPLVRLSGNDPVLAKRVMDAGAHGVIVPTVNSPEEAGRYGEAVADTVGLGRAHAYGPRFLEYVAELRDYAVVIVMIEHRVGVEQLDKILRVPGVDALFIGPYDLSASYGVPGQFEHPKMREAMARILAVAGEAQVPAGIHVVHPPVDQVRERLTEGFRFVAYCGDMLLLVPAVREAAAELNRLRSHESS